MTPVAAGSTWSARRERARRTACIAFLAAVVLPLQLAAAPAKGRQKPKKPSAAATAKKPKKVETAAGAAKRHLRDGTKAYKARNYEVALRELEPSYRAEPRSSTLRMLADSYFQLKDFVASYDAYRKLLDDHGDSLKPSERSEAEGMLKSLEALTSQIEVIVEEPSANISIDGRSVGRSPMQAPARVSAAKHQVRVTKQGFPPSEQEVELKPGERLVIPVQLGAAPTASGAATAQGKLTVTATPSDAAIDVDGKEAGTGTYEGTLPAGKHRLVVRAAGYASSREDVTVAEGETVARDVQLEKEGNGPAVAAAEAPASSSGLYVRLDAFGMLPIRGHVRQPCPEEGQCTSGLQLGGGGALRFGYAFGLLGVELVGAGLFEQHKERMAIQGTDDIDDPSGDYERGNIARFENFGFSSFAGFAGLGPRLTSQGTTFRVSLGVAGGIAVRKHNVRREVGGAIADSYRVGTTSVAPGALGDLTLSIGSTPGVKFLVGATAWAAFNSDVAVPSGDPRIIPVEYAGRSVDVTLSTPGYIVSRGMQLFVGPHIGLQLGN